MNSTVQVNAFSSDDEMNRAMQQKLEAIYADIHGGAPVAQAFAAYENAQENVAKLKVAQAGLTQRARRIFEEMKSASSLVEARLIESPVGEVDFKRLAALEIEHRSVSRANSRILEHLLPQAEIGELNREAEHLSAKAHAVREAANSRIEKTAKMMAEAAEHEGGIVFDSQNTLSGEMHAQATEFERQAVNYRTWALEREEQYLKLAREMESIRII
jgi:hypothetical protein